MFHGGLKIFGELAIAVLGALEGAVAFRVAPTAGISER